MRALRFLGILGILPLIHLALWLVGGEPHLAREKDAFCWNHKVVEAFYQLKQVLTKVLIFTLFDFASL